MIRLRWVRVKHGFDEGDALFDRDGRQLNPIRHVADGVDRRDVRLAIIVDQNLAALPGLHADRIKPFQFVINRAQSLSNECIKLFTILGNRLPIAKIRDCYLDRIG